MSRFSRLDFDAAPRRDSPEAPREELDGPGCMRAAEEQFDTGLYEAALRFYSRALQFDRELAAAWRGQVRCLLCLGECREAVIWATRGLERFPDDPELLAWKGLALVRSGGAAEGMEYVDGAVERRSPPAWVWVARGEALLAAEQPEVNAARCFMKARELAPEEWRIDLRIGIACVEAGLRAQARGPLLAAARRAEANPLVLYYLGRMYEGCGERVRAAGFYERAAAARPDYEEAAEGLRRTRGGGGLAGFWTRLTGGG